MLSLARPMQMLATRAIVTLASISGVAISFEAARKKTSDASFIPQKIGPNAELESAGSFAGTAAESIAAAVTSELNNNELLDGGVEAHIDAVVRTGITLVEPRTGDEELNASIRELWEMAAARADVTRLKSLGELQALYVRECRRAGEIFVRVVWAPAITVGGVKVPAGPAVELVPSERVPRTLSGIVPEGMPGAGNRVRGGIELNAAGQVEAVWVLKEHPDDASPFASSAFAAIGFKQFDSDGIERVSVAEITPRFYSRRAAQLRGVSPLCSALNTVRQLRTYVDASTTTATLAARMGVVMSVPNQLAFQKNPTAIMLDASGNPLAGMPKGAGFFFVSGASGPGADVTKHVTTIQGNSIGPAFEGFIKSMTRFVSRALRRTASQVSGDYEQTNFAGARMAQLDTSKSDERDQSDVWSMSTPYYRAVIDTGLARGQLKPSRETLATWAESPMGFEKIYLVSVTAPGAGYANPEQEARANASDIAVGIKSRVEACQERGVRYTDVVDETIAYELYEKRKREEAGLPARMDRTADVATAAPTEGSKDGGRDARPTKGGKDAGRNLKIAGGQE